MATEFEWNEAGYAAMLAETSPPARHHYSDMIEHDARDYVAKKTGALAGSIESFDDVDDDGPGTFTGSAISYAASNESGARPHIIRAHGPYSLGSRASGYFGPVVHHPGNRAYNWLKRALYQARGDS